MQLRNMSLNRLVRYFLAPFGVKLEIARLTCYLIVSVSMLYLAYVYTPKISEDRLTQLNAKFSLPCGTDIPLKVLDEVTRNRLWADFIVLATDVRQVNGLPWDVRLANKKEYVYSLDRITALVAFQSEFTWLNPKDRQFILKYISDVGMEIRNSKPNSRSDN